MALPNLAINGVWTLETRKALQRHMKFEGVYTGLIDGDFGSMSKKSLQKLLKKKGWYTGLIDGSFGEISSRALHNFLYTTWGSGPWLSWAHQAQMYYRPWDSWGHAGSEPHIRNVIRATQSGLNRHGKY